MAQIKFFDTTLRDGEQTPGVNLNKPEKLEIARQLERLGMDEVLEAGFSRSPRVISSLFKKLPEPLKQLPSRHWPGLSKAISIPLGKH